jgi:hypothetical protein
LSSSKHKISAAEKARLERHFRAASVNMPGFFDEARGKATLWASHLEDNLDRLLWNFMVDDSAERARLLDPEGAAGSFGTKARLAYLLGLIAFEEYIDLKSIAKIRNQLAHSASAFVSFETKPAKDLIVGLKVLQYYPEMTPSQSPDLIFDFACGCLSHRIRYRTRVVLSRNSRRSLPEPVAYRFQYAHDYREITGLTQEEALLFASDAEEIDPGIFYFVEADQLSESSGSQEARLSDGSPNKAPAADG